MIKTKRIKDDVEVSLQVKNVKNQVLIEKNLSLKKDLTIDPDYLRYSEMCESVHAKHRKAL